MLSLFNPTPAMHYTGNRISLLVLPTSGGTGKGITPTFIERAQQVTKSGTY
jgi:hypothetical protein